MPEFFHDMPGGVYDNIYDDLDDSPVTWHITEVSLSLHVIFLFSSFLLSRIWRSLMFFF
jgi:hypothetical protein